MPPPELPSAAPALVHSVPHPFYIKDHAGFSPDALPTFFLSPSRSVLYYPPAYASPTYASPRYAPPAYASPTVQIAMPSTTKRVHFDLPTATPSPSFSDTSLPSSAGPNTPPQFAQSPLYPVQQFLDSPASFASVPYASAHVRIHPALVTPNAALIWDMVQHPAAAYDPSTAQPLPPALLAAPATQPPLPSLTIICDLLPWSITVTPAPASALSPRPQCITVGDVLGTVYRTLRLAVSDVELNYLPHEVRERVHAAYHTRCRIAPDERTRMIEKSKGVKRVDFLMEARRFVGLAIVMGGPPLKGKGLGEVWSLQVALA
ncbi:uncharacterized protein LAESUDRAFT_699456 [Laetiporus sulphureus 93-53]|uniref:DUF6699 domain-containing protein n=1 Tax=Laetiporus sulphureus 93-53 TaxID=1314785 RepID=A0A165EHM4_9APHY|nr:uncharacterized protein LAESUDRAFT_699456 [Laetiporus sulphureus 93-53]KZT07068.1 hypothetical protein LAESUDRAFT_699456 [Laetiporus sulphureus 93-53]